MTESGHRSLFEMGTAVKGQSLSVMLGVLSRSSSFTGQSLGAVQTPIERRCLCFGAKRRQPWLLNSPAGRVLARIRFNFAPLKSSDRES